jgi:hypothetical protein
MTLYHSKIDGDGTSGLVRIQDNLLANLTLA